MVPRSSKHHPSICLHGAQNPWRPKAALLRLARGVRRAGRAAGAQPLRGGATGTGGLAEPVG